MVPNAFAIYACVVSMLCSSQTTF